VSWRVVPRPTSRSLHPARSGTTRWAATSSASTCAARSSRTDLLPNGSARGHQPTGDQPAFAMEAVDEGRVAFRLNRTLSLQTALKIANILAEEDRT
jgi:hypothetical protein